MRLRRPAPSTDPSVELRERIAELEARLDHERLYPVEWANRRIRDRLGDEIQAGPFRGMRYPDWAMTRVDLARYPDYQWVTSLAAGYFGVEPEWVVLTNGLDEGLHAVAQAAAVAFWRGSGDRARPATSSAPPTALVIEPAFEMYRLCAEAAGFDVVAVLPNDDLTCSLRSARGAHTETRPPA
jgi:hypothetical protein